MRLVRCKCSRCQLFVRAPKDGFDFDDSELKKTVFEQREYQTALIELAKKRNIVACLPTGSGKTFIAFKLIEYFQGDILSEKKKVIFLANTIPLVNQQAAFFARNTGLKVKHLTGDMEVDYWSEEKWNAIIDGFEILAMTSQIFVNILQHAYIKLSQVALLILDECHHAFGSHPMKLVMQKIHETKNAEPNYPLPRVLGMTATIVMGNCEPHQVPDRVSELERTMHAKAVTYKDYEAVLQHSTRAQIITKMIPSGNTLDWEYAYSLDELKRYAEELNVLRKERKKLKAANCGIVDGIDPTLLSSNNIYHGVKNPTPGDLRVVIDDVRYICLNLGPYCGVIAINLRLAFIEFSLLDLTDKVIKNWYIKIRDFLIGVRDNLIRLMNSLGVSEKDKILTFVAPRLTLLIKILEEFREAESSSPDCAFNTDDDRLCGLVFTDRRVTAQVLSWYFMDLASEHEDYSYIKAHFVVGTSRCPFETVESRIYAKKQTETIIGFRNNRYNLLIATSVLEEGIDVPSCNMVIRFDRILTYTSFVQSMGRARKRNAKFYAFLATEDYYKEAAKLDKFQEVNRHMVRHLVNSVEKIDEPVGSMIVDHDVEPFRPGGTPDSPSISMESAQDVIERYCNLLPCDGIASLQVMSWWSQIGLKFVGHVKLPMNSLVRGTITGRAMSTKDLAKQAVFFEAAKRLYEADALDESLLAIRPAFPHQIDVFFKTVTSQSVPEDEEEGEVLEKDEVKPSPQAEDKKEFTPLALKKDWYEKRVPKALKDHHFVPGSEYQVYRITLKLTQPSEGYTWPELYKLQDRNYAFGIISAAKIPEIGSFPLYGGFGCITASLTVIPDYFIKMTPSALNAIVEFQDTMFAEVLDLKHPVLLPQLFSELSYVIVPLVKLTGPAESWKWRLPENVFTRDKYSSAVAELRSIFEIQKSRPPREKDRSDNNRTRSVDDFVKKYKDAVVVTWYSGKPKSIYCVDQVATNMTPLSKFHDENFATYKDFIESQYNTKIFDLKQPLLKCKLAGVGKGRIQINYLLEKVAKEDQYPVYLVPELCFKLPLPASRVVQLKMLPSFLHRLNRLLLVREIVDDLALNYRWPGAMKCVNTSLELDDDLQRLSVEHEEKRKHEQQRREEARKRFRRDPGPIPAKQSIYDRELHYEFIHPNKITPEHIKLFHEAVSSQHAAKKITLPKDTKAEFENEDLSVCSKIELIPVEQLSLPSIDHNLDFDKDAGPSLLALLEALTLSKSNDGASNVRLSKIGSSLMNFVISAYVYQNFPGWSEPQMCQLRNRFLTIQFMTSVAKRRNLAEILSASDFYPGTAWLPPAFKVIDHIGRIAADNKVNFEVYESLGPRVKNMTKLQLEDHVRINASIFIANREYKGPAVTSLKPEKGKKFVKKATGFSSFTHTEILDIEIADGLYALIGAFFKKCGMLGTFKFLEWLGFPVPDLEGKEQIFAGLSSAENRENNRALEILKLIPGALKLEEIIQYKFNDLTLLAEAVTHPTYFANNVSDCYQRLEFLGDSILDALLTNYIMSKSTKSNQKHIEETKSDKYSTGELMDIRAAVVNNVTYASLAVRYELQKCLLSMSKPLLDMIDNFVVHQEAVEHQVVGHFTLISDEECWGPKHMEVPKVLADIFEALAGAIYIDSGYSLDKTWAVFYRLMQNEIDEFSEVPLKPPYREIQEVFPGKVSYQKMTSKKLRDKGRDMVKITIDSYGHYYGHGTNLNRAREAASKIALKIIRDDEAFLKNRSSASEIMLLM